MTGRKRYFEGWYFKQQAGEETVAFIPALHIEEGFRSASLQIITREASHYIRYPYDQFRADRRNASVKIGSSLFSKSRIELEIFTDRVTATGVLSYGKPFPLGYDIMGFFRFFPFMECRHSVFSMMHSVNGMLAVNGRKYVFTDGTGYMEGDRGRSFPTRYAWTQCCWKEETPCSLMLSVADIPYLGTKFTGVICAIVLEGREIRLATYLGAKVESIEGGRITIKQDPYRFTAELLERNGLVLRAPVLGGMTRLIRENPSCRARYRLSRDGAVLFDFISDNASFEYEYGGG